MFQKKIKDEAALILDGLNFKKDPNPQEDFKNGKYIIDHLRLIDVLKIQKIFDLPLTSDIGFQGNDTITPKNSKKYFMVEILNDDHHSFTEVIHILRIACKYSYERANQMAWKVHNSGSCGIFKAESKQELEKVINIINSISLGYKVTEIFYPSVEEQLLGMLKDVDFKREKSSSSSTYSVYLHVDRVHNFMGLVQGVLRHVPNANNELIESVFMGLNTKGRSALFNGTKDECLAITKKFNEEMFNVSIEETKPYSSDEEEWETDEEDIFEE